MLNGIKLEMLDKLNYLIQLSNKGRDNFPDEVCNFIAQELELQASVLFKLSNDSSLFVLGKSSSAKKNYIRGTKFNCSVCKIVNNEHDFSISSDTNCELQISEYMIYENCVTFKINNTEKGFLKIAKNTPFSASDTEAIKKTTDLTGTLLANWAETRGGSLTISDSSFNEIIQKTLTELRAPANSIIGFTSILSDDSLTSSQSEYLSTIRTNAQSLLLTVNDIIDLTKLEAGTVANSYNHIKISTLLSEIVNIYKQKTSGKLLNFNLSVGSELSNEISIDDKRLRYILNNIFLVISNISYNGEIVVKAASEGKKITIKISSSSAKLSEDNFKNLFKPFTTDSIEELKNTNLTGLGLPLVKKYTASIGGSIQVNHDPQLGLVFNLIFNSGGENNLSSIINQIPQPTDSNKILVIEDDYATSKLMSNYLDKWGYAPIIVNTKEQTLSLIQKEKFLAIILDIELPNTNGLELLKQINEHPNTKNTPVIVCSIEAEQQKAYLMGAVEYFVKPINYNYLVEILTSYKLRKNSNVLCVDDDLPTLNLVKQAIETAGFNAIAEHISANVLDLISNKPVELAIIDLDMPHPNGFELIELIKSQDKYKNLPIIIYTGKENYQEDLQKIDGLFTQLLDKKSTNIEDLADTIEKMVNRVESTPPEELSEQKDDETINILLAEDYKHSQIIVTRLLKKNGYENIVVVENGEEAYNMTKKEKFDLILMDMQMPIMNGFEATEHIRQLPEYKNTPVIALTAFAMKGDREKCLDAGATDYIPKPIDSKEFIEKVKYYTNS